MKKMFRTGIVLALVALSAVSCVTNRKIAYLQDMKHMTQIELENRFEAVISPYDELDVIISSFDPELARPFNLRNTSNADYNVFPPSGPPAIWLTSTETSSFRSWEKSMPPA